MACVCRNAVDGVRPSADSKGAAPGGSTKETTANESFSKHYNKELKVAEGKISINIV